MEQRQTKNVDEAGLCETSIKAEAHSLAASRASERNFSRGTKVDSLPIPGPQILLGPPSHKSMTQHQTREKFFSDFLPKITGS